ncbi:hypothetical protein PQR25_03970 [Paraburkholderia nemoris]|jgi:hypothetical protein|uniref:hypothetical protein n=1 Tax=Paraburkholderia nemoris TaxID=2793076 RepID=UPI0038BB9056
MIAISDPVSAKRRVAVLLTGVPRGYARCVAPLRFLLEECEVAYHAVIREEFATPQTLDELRDAYPGVTTIVVPTNESRKAVAPFEGKAVASTLVMMWQEIAYATARIADLASYQCVLRMRFDIYTHRQYLPEVRLDDGDVWLPSQMSWSGSNDMMCLAAPREFAAYAGTFGRLESIVAEGIVVPEAIMARSIAMARLAESALDVYFVLYRDALFSGVDDARLRILAHVHPALSTYKLGGRDDSPERRAREISEVERLSQHERGFPLYEARNAGSNFYPVETDDRDGSAFRWMGVHAHMNVAISRRARSLSFVVHFHIAGWEISKLKVLADGYPLNLEVIAVDGFGRQRVSASLQGVALRRPWSKIGFSCGTFAIPSESGANPNDHRLLSVAIGVPVVDEGDDVEPYDRARR